LRSSCSFLTVLPGTEGIRPYLLATQFDAWHGFLRVPADWDPVLRAGVGLRALRLRSARDRVRRLPCAAIVTED
jgi:hypothetical protein